MKIIVYTLLFCTVGLKRPINYFYHLIYFAPNILTLVRFPVHINN